MNEDARQAARYLRKLAEAHDREIERLTQEIERVTQERDNFRRMADQVDGTYHAPSAPKTTSIPTAKGAAQDTLMVVFNAHPTEPLRVKQIVAEAEANGVTLKSDAAVRATLQRMLENGKVVQPGVGQYMKADAGPNLDAEARMWPLAAVESG